MYRFKASDDVDILRKAEDEAMQRPDNFAFFGDRDGDEVPFETHAPVYSWADRGDDLVAESNFHVMLEELQGIDSDNVYDTSESHWLVGSLRVIYVRVYGPPAEFMSPDPVTLYSNAFRAAVDMAHAMADYPLLDDSDFSQRESEAWMATVTDALDSAARKHNDTPEFEAGIWSLLVGYHNDGSHLDLWDEISHGDSSPDSVDWDAAQRVWDACRDTLYEYDAASQWAAIVRERQTPPEGQEPLRSEDGLGWSECGCGDPYCQA